MREEGPSPRRLIVTADDMGFSAARNDAIVRACEAGIVTSTSVATTGRFYGDAARSLQCGGIDHGLHLDLLDGVPLSAATEIASLVDRRGRFRSLRDLLLRFASGRVRTDEVELEWRRQIERATADGLRPTHVNAHYHLHLLPGIFEVVVRLANRFGIGWIRILDEPPWFTLRVPGGRPGRLAKAIALWILSCAQRSSADGRAIGHVGCRGVAPGERAWHETLRGIRGQVTEVFCHPGQSAAETGALMSAALRRRVDGHFRRTSFAQLSGAS